jgi:DNA polymerase I
MGRLLIIDGNAILHRAYHAIPATLTRSDGTQMNAVFGFASILLRVIHDLKPTHLVVTFDRPKPTFRKEMYKEYQATRPKMDVELSGQIQMVHDVVAKLGVPIFEKDGFEADDIIGTIAQRAIGQYNNEQITDNKKQSREVEEVVIVTGDRDILQLVNDHVKVFMPVKGISEGKLYGEKEVEERLGVLPSQVVDYKALVGDQSDNYPGVDGVGPKTANTLLEKFGTLETLYARLDEVENEKLRDKLKEHVESAEMSKKLATIVRDVPIEFSLEKCRLPVLDRPDIRQYFEELEMRSLIPRLSSDTREQITNNKTQITKNNNKTEIKAQQIGLF